MKKNKIHILLIFFALLLSVNTYATKRYWRGTGATKNWNTTTNWAATSGGATGSSVPASTDSVYFDSGGDSTCTVNATISIKYLNIASSYTHTISQGAFAITIGTSGAVLSGGTFSGGSLGITDNGVFTLSGTNFTSTSNILTINNGNYNYTSGTFTHNNGKVKYLGTISVTGSTTFYDLEIGTASVITLSGSSTFDVNHTFTQSGASNVQINTGTLNLKGDINQTNTYANSGGGTGTLNICGTGSQTFSGQSSSGNYALGWLCNVKINKSSGTLYLKDIIVIGGTWEYVAGTVDITTYTNSVSFPAAGGATNIVKGKQTLSNLIVTNTTVTVNSGDTLTLSGGITTNGNAATGYGGIINLHGDITLNNTFSATATGGTGTIIINGTSGQTINGTASMNQSRLCNVKINKTSGTLTLKNYVSIGGDWSYIQGTIDASTYTSTVCFPSSAGRTISGKHTLFNVLFHGISGGSSISTISATDTLTVAGALSTEGTNLITISTGVMKALGDININSTLAGTGNLGTATIRICGTSNQTINGASSIGVGSLCNVKIDKPSGTLILKNTVSAGADWKYLQGTIDASTYTSTVCFPYSAGRTISGNHSLYNVSFYAPSGGSTSTISSSDTLTVLNNLTTDGAQWNIINSGTINLKGNLIINNTSTSVLQGGTATMLFSGTSSQTFTGASASLTGRVCNVKINKPSGTLTLKNFVNIGGDWKYVNGTIDASTYASTVVFPNSAGRTISGKHSLYNILFYSESVTTSTNNITSTDTLTCLGELKLSGTNYLNINTGTINATGDIRVTNTASPGANGTGFINICGTGNQIFTGSGIVIGGNLCNVYVNKPSGTLSLSSIISLASNAHWKYIQGTVNPGSSTCVFIGGADINGGAMPFNNFTISGGATSTLSGILNVNGTFYIQAARTLNTNSYDINLGGNWDNNGTFTSGTTKVTFNGNGGQYILHPSVGQGFYDLVINKPTGKLYSYNAFIQVNNSLTLTKGVIAASAAKYVLLIDNATASGGWDSSYVSGPVKKIGNDAFTFPLGDSVLSTGAYHPLTITAPSVTSDSYTVTYRDSVQSSGSTLQTDSLSSISTCERWLLTRNVGTSVVVPTLGWNSNSCNVDGCHKLRVAAWDGTWWTSLGYNGITTSGARGTVAAHSGYSTASLPLVIAQPVNPSLSPTVTVSSNITICSTTSTNLTAAGATTYSWAPSTGLSSTTGTTVTATPSATTTYTVTGTNTIGCTGTATVTVTIITTPTVAVSPTSTTVGSGIPVTIVASGASTYSWLPTTHLSPTTGTTVVATATATTTYTVTGTATNGCTGTATSLISIKPNCTVVTLVSGTVCIQTPVTLTASMTNCDGSHVTFNFGDGYSLTDTVTNGHPASNPHTYTSVGSYTITSLVTDLSGHIIKRDTAFITITSCAVACDDCIPSFAPIPAKKYELSAWSKQSGAAATVTNYTAPKITVSSSYGSYSAAFTPSGPIIDGWQKIDGEFTLPGLATDIKIKLESTSGDTYFDDIRVFPFDGSMKSYVYDPINMRLVAELDERNYATFYEYDEEGKLVRVKKETERGIMTIKENRNNTKK